MAITRRRFASIAGTTMLARGPLMGQLTPLTAQQIVERIQKNVGVPWRAESLDGFKAGEPAAEVTGIATTAMATMDVLTRAIKEKANLVVTLEPAYFGRLDSMPGADDPVYAAKKEFIQKNGLIVWRFTDHWRARQPDPFATGLARTLAWVKYQVNDDPFRYDLPGGTLSALADDLAKRLYTRAGIRVIGDPQTRIRRVALMPGLSTLAAAMKAMPEVDLILAGETREWESVEYAQDTVASGQKKGLIMLGRVVSQDPGMNVCAEWLKTLVPEVPVQWIPAGDPYWRPA